MTDLTDVKHFEIHTLKPTKRVKHYIIWVIGGQKPRVGLGKAFSGRQLVVIQAGTEVGKA